MIEIPTKNAAAYTSLFQQLGRFAQKHNDRAGVDENPAPDQVELSSLPQPLYAAGDLARLKAELTQGVLSAVQVEITATEREPYQATLCLRKSAAGLEGSESLHNERGLQERTFTITGDTVRVESNNQDSLPYPTPDPGQRRRMSEELEYLTGNLQYLVGPGFPQ